MEILYFVPLTSLWFMPPVTLSTALTLMSEEVWKRFEKRD